MTARRDLRDLEDAIRRADLLLRRSTEARWSGRAAEGYRDALADLHGRVRRAVAGLDLVEATMTRHLLAVEESRRQPTPGGPAGALPSWAGVGGR